MGRNPRAAQLVLACLACPGPVMEPGCLTRHGKKHVVLAHSAAYARRAECARREALRPERAEHVTWHDSRQLSAKRPVTRFSP
jgi:hypothetical protein